MTIGEGLTVQEKLLLAQAVYKVGAVDWTTISALLLEHPICTPRPHALFSPKACEESYVGMMTSIGQNVPAPDAMKPRNKTHLRLAQTFYVARLQELKEQIEACENKFSVLMGEINALKNGSMDESIRDEIKNGLIKRYGQKILQWLPDSEETLKTEETAGAQPTQEEKAAVSGETEEPVENVEAVEAVESVETLKPEEAAVESTEPVESVSEQEKDVEMAGGSTDEPEKAEEEAVVEEIEETTPKANPPEQEVNTATATPRLSSPTPSDELSPPPSAVKESEDPATPAQTAPSPSPAEPTRASKRKASTQPRGAPGSKRGPGRPKGASPVPAPSEQPSDHEQGEQEVEHEEPEEAEEGRRGRRASRRHKAQDTPPPTSRARGSSPATSRRAPSVSSNASTPAATEEKRPRRGARASRGMRDEVVSKSVREQSLAAESVKEEEEEEAESPIPEEKETRTTRNRRGKKEPSPVEEKKEKEGRRSTRSVKTPQLLGQEGDNDDHEERGEKASTVTPAVEGKRGHRKSEPKDVKATQKILLNLWEDIHGHQHGAVFHAPVKKSEAADYYSIIKKPMDLKTIKLRVKDGTITSIDEFERDILLMFANAMMYNEEGSQVYEMAMEMSKAVEGKIAHFRGMQNDMKR